MSVIYDLVDDDLAGALPDKVAAQLFDLGLASNSAALAYQHARLMEEQSHNALSAAPLDNEGFQFRRLIADEQAQTALAMTEQHLATYSLVAATYATFASKVITAVMAGALLAVEVAEPVQPSSVLADPDWMIPAVMLPAGTMGVLRDVEQARQRVITAATAARSSGTIECYDGRRAAANRSPGEIDLSAEVPIGLHAYATLLVEALGSLAADR
ncbi:hypothetical protein ACFO1B_56250 [Dactylosporangium siamense]|nr:hypothetical protein [Dactylosporangium siamense]